MQPRQQRHLGRLAEIRYRPRPSCVASSTAFGSEFGSSFKIERCRIASYNSKSFFDDIALRADFAEALQIIRIFAIDNDRRVPGRFVHDVGRRRVFDVMDLAHVARDDENLVGLEFHERRRRNESVHRDRAPADLAEDVVHLLDARNALERDAGVEQSLEINFVRVFLQEKNVLAHDETPDRVIDRRVFVVALIDRELQKMFGSRRDGRIVVGIPLSVFTSALLLVRLQLMTRPCQRAGMICVRIHDQSNRR